MHIPNTTLGYYYLQRSSKVEIQDLASDRDSSLHFFVCLSWTFIYTRPSAELQLRGIFGSFILRDVPQFYCEARPTGGCCISWLLGCALGTCNYQELSHAIRQYCESYLVLVIGLCAWHTMNLSGPD